MNRGILIALLAGSMLCGCGEDPTDRADYKYILDAVGDRGRYAEKSIRYFCKTPKIATNVFCIVASAQLVQRDVGQTRESAWMEHIHTNLQCNAQGELLTKDLIRSIEFALSPMVVYMDKMEQLHPEWDMKQMEAVFFQPFQKYGH